ncbi:MAG: TonB-dependent receptor [Gilvibacter sp.]
MTYKKQLLLILILFIYTAQSLGQGIVQYESLQATFEKAQEKFNCSFSYQDAAIQGHKYNKKIPNTLPKLLEELSTFTLFDFRLLPDNTVTVRPKEGLVQKCVIFVDQEGNQITQTVEAFSEFQVKRLDAENPMYFDQLNDYDYITVYAPNYELTAVPLDKIKTDECYTVTLRPEVQVLDLITITNYLSKGITKKPEGGINIDYSEFDILPGLIESDVLLTLQALPGIQSVNETVSYLNIRGGTNDQNLILWDGIKMYQNGHFFGLISAFNPSLTSEVTVYKNGADPEFGDGVSGVIKMQGNPALVDSLNGSAGLNLLSADAYLELPLGKKASIQVAGRHSINGLLQTPTYSSYFDKAFQNTEVVNTNATQTNTNDDFSFFDAHLRLQFQPDYNNQFRANLLVLGNSLNFLENEQVANTNISLASGLDQQNYSAGLYYNRIWNPRLQTQVQLYGTNYTLMSTNQDISNNQRLVQENDILESGIKTIANYSYSSRWNFQFGVQLNETGITNSTKLNNPTFEESEKKVLRTSSAFTKASFGSANRKTRLDLGLRVNHISKFDQVLVEPRLRFRQRLSQSFWVELLGELKSQTTSQVIDLQNDFLGVENRRWILSNPDEIPIIKGAQASMGITFRRNGLLLSASPYIKEIKGITTQSQGFENQFENIKTDGSYRVYGVDFLANKQYENLNLWVSYSYAKNDYTFSNLIPESFPNNIDLRHSVTTGANLQLSDFTIALGLNWNSGKPTTLPAAQDPIQNGILIYQSPNAQNIASYFRLDASARYTFAISKSFDGFAGISLWNILGTDNTLLESYRISDAYTVDKITDNSLSFTPNLFFKIRF